MRVRSIAMLLLAFAALGLIGVSAVSQRNPVDVAKEWIGAVGPALLAVVVPAERSKGAGGAPQAGPPPEVVVSQPVRRRLVEWDEYTGRFDAVESVELRTRVAGYLTEIKFTDGQDVKAGDLLFVIDPRPFERALGQAEAELAQARVKVSNSSLDVDRGRPLVERNVISQKTQDDRENLWRDAEAALKVAESKVETAKLDLSFTRITAPVAGRIGRTLVTIGNFVSAGGSQGSTLLTTIVSQDPIYVYFDVNENNAIKLKRIAEANGKGWASLIGAPVAVALPDEKGFPHVGKLDFLDNRIDAATGTWRARAVVENKRGLFSAGMFVRARMQGTPEYEALLLPDEAIGTDQTSRYVLVAGDDGTTQRRPVKLGPLADGLRIVRDGVGAEDWVVVKGQARVRPGMKVGAKREQITISEADVGTTATGKSSIRLQKP